MTVLSVIGAGKVGSEVAFLSAVRGLADEIILYDNIPDFLNAQKLDLLHTGIKTEISTDPEKIKDSDIAVFAAGIPRTPAIKTRADLLEANLAVAGECAQYLKGFSGILITVTNPMDANNYFFKKALGLKREQCIGFGGQLDSARFSLYLRERGFFGDAFVIGEHGEHQVPLFSKTDGAGRKIDVTTREEILSEMQRASMPVISGKGGTVFGPSYHISSLLDVVISDRREIMPCSVVLDGEYGLKDCSMGVPARIGREGILEIIEWELDEWEYEKIKMASEHLNCLCRKV